MKRIVVGAAGRLGSAVSSRLADTHEVVAVYSTPPEPPAAQGFTDLTEALRKTGTAVVIDCAPAAGVQERITAVQVAGLPLALGSTGLSKDDTTVLQRAGERIPVVVAPNFSPGMTVFECLLEQAGNLVPDWDASILDRHHMDKRDAPSGTARHLAEIWPGDVDINSARQGEVIGEHSVFLAGSGEELILTHRALSRDVFARGAALASEFLESAQPGCYTMRDVLRQTAES